MQNLFQPDNQSLDDQLADFVDHLMKDDSKVEYKTDNEELLELQKTAFLIKKAFDVSHPSTEVSGKTKRNLLSYWRQSISSIENAPFWRKMKDQFSLPTPRNRGFVFNFAILAALLLAVVIFFLSDPAASGLTATAGVQENLPWFVLAVGVILLVVFIWLWRGK